MSLKRSMLKTLAMLAMESTMTADKNIYSNQRLSNEGMRLEISPDNWIMTVESNNEALIELSKIYDIVWRQCPCLKGIMNTNVTPELERLACEQMKG